MKRLGAFEFFPGSPCHAKDGEYNARSPQARVCAGLAGR